MRMTRWDGMGGDLDNGFFESFTWLCFFFMGDFSGVGWIA